MGVRDIPKVLDDVAKAFKPTKANSFPSPHARLLGLIRHFKKEKGLDTADGLIDHEYKILKTVARKVHDDMVDEIYKKLKKDDQPIILPLWSQVSSDTVQKYTYTLERNAGQHGFTLSRCQHSWAARLLLSEAHKHRSNRSRMKAAVFDHTPDTNNDLLSRYIYNII